MDGDGRQDRSRTHDLYSEVYTNAERQAILSAWVHVQKKGDFKMVPFGTLYPGYTLKIT